MIHGYKKGTKRVHHTEWEVGKVYFLENGESPFILTVKVPCGPHHLRDEMNLRMDYLSGIKDKTTTKTYLIEAEGETEMLYEFNHNGKTVFGTKIATNSSGLWVMELKGSGDVVTVEKTKVEEVIPYSIGVMFMATPGRVYHYTAPKDKFDLGFYLFDNHNGQSLVQVVELDTKSKQATKEFTPSLKFVTEKVE